MKEDLSFEALQRSTSDGEPPPTRPPLSEQAYQIIRDRILRGITVAGEKLKLDVLQKDLEISSSPLREALNRLAAENLVVADERRGFRAAPVNAEDLIDLTATRVVVEPGALFAAIKAGSDLWESQIVAAFHRLELIERRVNAGQSSRDDVWTARHKEFHMALISGCGSARLVNFCSKLFDESERYRRLSASFRKKTRNTAGEHKRLMEAALARDPKGVSLLRRHIELTSEHVTSSLAHIQSTR